MNYRLAYGVTGLTIKLPDSYDTDLIEPIWIGGKYDQQQAITEAARELQVKLSGEPGQNGWTFTGLSVTK